MTGIRIRSEKEYYKEVGGGHKIWLFGGRGYRGRAGGVLGSVGGLEVEGGGRDDKGVSHRRG